MSSSQCRFSVRDITSHGWDSLRCQVSNRACPNLPTAACIKLSQSHTFFLQCGDTTIIFPMLLIAAQSTMWIVHAAVRVSGRAPKNRTSQHPLSSLIDSTSEGMGRWSVHSLPYSYRLLRRVLLEVITGDCEKKSYVHYRITESLCPTK